LGAPRSEQEEQKAFWKPLKGRLMAFVKAFKKLFRRLVRSFKRPFGTI
jgi:hypothetical protein